MASEEIRQLVRRARPADASRVEAAVAAAFELHIAVLGRLPRPMLVDYERALWRDARGARRAERRPGDQASPISAR